MPSSQVTRNLIAGRNGGPTRKVPRGSSFPKS